MSRPPRPPAAAPTRRPTASSATAAAGPCPAWPPPAAPASATDTNGVAIPSLRPLSTLISRRILAGTSGLAIMPAPSAASVGASAAPTSSASQMPALRSRANASSAPRPIVTGSAAPSSRRYRPESARSSCSQTREASENRTRARVNSARVLISSLLGVTPRTASGPWVSSSPASTNVIGAGTSNRSSRADSVPHPNTRTATIARSATLTRPAPSGRRRTGRSRAGPDGQRALGLGGLALPGEPDQLPHRDGCHVLKDLLYPVTRQEAVRHLPAGTSGLRAPAATAASRLEASSAATATARWHHGSGSVPGPAARSRRGRDSRISPGGVGFRHPQVKRPRAPHHRLRLLGGRR